MKPSSSCNGPSRFFCSSITPRAALCILSRSFKRLFLDLPLPGATRGAGGISGGPPIWFFAIASSTARCTIKATTESLLDKGLTSAGGGRSISKEYESPLSPLVFEPDIAFKLSLTFGGVDGRESKSEGKGSEENAMSFPSSSSSVVLGAVSAVSWLSEANPLLELLLFLI